MAGGTDQGPGSALSPGREHRHRNAPAAVQNIAKDQGHAGSFGLLLRQQFRISIGEKHPGTYQKAFGPNGAGSWRSHGVIPEPPGEY